MLGFYRYFIANTILISGTFEVELPRQKSIICIGEILHGRNIIAPYYAGVVHPGRILMYCGAVIISNIHLLTAARCMKNTWPPTRYYVATGSPLLDKRNKFFLKSYKNHPQYDEKINDISILTLNRSLTFGEDAQPIALPKATDRYEVGQLAVVVGSKGWNSEKKQDDVPILHRGRCAEKLRDRRSILCVGRIDEIKKCWVHPGGPLVLNNKVIGLVSYDTSCVKGTIPNVYTNVKMFLDFIYEETNNLMNNYCFY